MNDARVIVDKFQDVLSRWQREKLTGKLNLEINLNQGGITGFSIYTKGDFETAKVLPESN